MRSGITFDGEATVQKVYFDAKRKKYYAVVIMKEGIIEYPDTTARLKIPITNEQYDNFMLNQSTQRDVRLVGKLEVISEE